MKKYNALLVATALLAVPAISSANIVIGDFEGGLVNGWYESGTTAESSTTGITLNAASLKVTDADGGWGGGVERPLLGDTDAVNAFLASGAKVTADITVVGSEVTEWMQVGLIINADGYWGAVDFANLNWDETNYGVEFEIPADAQSGIAAGGMGWLNVGLVMNASGNGASSFYVDNVQIIPEPATIGLFGLAGAALLVSRRHFKS